METYVARQPIFDIDRKLAAYELLFRAGAENVFPQIDGNVATSKLLSSAFLGFDIKELSNNKAVFINFTEELIVQDIPRLFPKDRIVVEVLEDVTATPEIQQRLTELAKDGYTIALDDFEYDPSLEPLIDLASIIKFDFRLTPLDEIEELIGQLQGRDLRFLAEKVEDYDEFSKALDLGCELFQGYFFSKPEVLGSRDLGPSKLNLIQLLKHIYNDDYEIDKIEQIMNSDVGLSYKLLRYLNSALFSTTQEITSIRHAIAYLGISETRRFVSLLALAEMGDAKPHELISSSVIRAKFCECLTEFSTEKLDADEMFLLGLFSELDAILDSDMATIMELLPISANIKHALTSNNGSLWTYLELAKKYEAGDWRHISTLARKLGLKEIHLPHCYAKALQLSNQLDKA